MAVTAPPVIQSNAINVTVYGAIGNGVMDDTAAIQAAANAAAAAGKQLYFPPGVYNVSAALQMSSNATWIAAPATVTLVATAGNPIITAVETQNDTASGLTLAGSPSATVPQALLIAYKATGFTLVDSTIQNTSGIGALFSDVNNTTVYGTSFSNIGNNTNLALSAQGVAFTNDTAGDGNNNIVESSSFSSIGLDAISATGQTGFSAIANTVYDTTINPGWGTQNAAAAGVYGNNDTGLVVADNHIHGVSGNGVDIDNSSNVSIYQNTVSGTGSAGIALYSSVNGTISWNAATNNDVLQHFQSVGGIVVGAQNASNIEIADNVSGNTGSVTTQPYGIQIIDGQDITSSSLLIVQNNTLTGNSSAAISDPQGSYGSIPAANMPAISYTIPVNDPPFIGGIAGTVSTASAASIKPFATATITDSDLGVAETLTVTVSGGDANGKLTGSGIVETSTPGTYAIGAAGITPATATALLQAAVFTPTPGGTPMGTPISPTLTITDLQTSPTSPATVSSGAIVTASNASPCFAAGTRIMTAARWPVAVEALSPGDEVAVLGGGAEKIVWIGHRTINTTTHPRPESVYPVLITAGALGGHLPRRDLLVSPDHALYLDGHLIPAKTLTNGFSIRQVKRRIITYYHIELARHAVVFAEGAAAESYLDTGNRAAFDNGGPAALPYPDFAQTLREQSGCAPFAEAGAAVEAVRQRHLDNANIACTADPELTIRYHNGTAIITSRSAIPGELTADPRDRRRLGVKIATVEVEGITIPLGHAALRQGWHDPEPDGRWTNGRAIIPKALLTRGGPVTLRLAATLAYPARTQKPILSPGK